jgi:hypothetical protein
MPIQLKAPALDARPAAVASVWRRYLDETRAASSDSYELIEDMAWRALSRRLERIGSPIAPRTGAPA